MTSTTTFKCNCCGHEQQSVDTPRGMSVLEVYAKTMYGYNQSQRHTNYQPQVYHICDKCAEDKFLFKSTPAGTPQPDLGDFIRGMVDDAVHDALKDRGI